MAEFPVGQVWKAYQRARNWMFQHQKARCEFQLYCNSIKWQEYTYEMNKNGLRHADFNYDYEDLIVLKQTHPGRHPLFEKWVVDNYDELIKIY